jgi:hypothetical protein
VILCSPGGQLRVVTCCAADAVTGKVEIRGADDDVLPADTWVTVTGTWRPKGTLGSDEAWPPVLDAVGVAVGVGVAAGVAGGVAGGVAQVKLPADPYEKP